MTDEADGEENVRVPFNLVAISEVGQDEGNGGDPSHHSELVPEGRGRAGKEGGAAVSGTTTAFGGASTREGGEWPNGVG